MVKTGKMIVPIVLVLFSVFSLCAYADNDEDSYEENSRPLTVTLWSCEDYTYEFDLDDNYQSVTSAFIQGEEYYDEGSEEYYDSSVAGRKCFGIQANDVGYYALLLDDPSQVVFKSFVQNTDNESIEEPFKDSIEVLNDDNLTCGIIFKMEKPGFEYAFTEECQVGNYKVKMLYLGENIISAESACPLVYDYYADAYQTICYDENGNDFTGVEMYPYIDLKFSNGETLKVTSYSITKDLKTSGTVTIETDILDRTFEVDIEYVKASELVESISLPENFVPSCTISYDGIISNLKFPEYSVLKLADGTEMKLNRNDRVILPNGRSYDYWIEYSVKEEGVFTDSVSFCYSLNGIESKEINFKPNGEPVMASLKSLWKNYFTGAKLALKIFQGSAGDWSKEDAWRLLFSLPKQLISVVKCYCLLGEIWKCIPVILICLIPFGLVVLIVNAKVRLKRRKLSAD